MKHTLLSLALVAISGAVGLSLSGGHAMLRTEPVWTDLGVAATTGTATPPAALVDRGRIAQGGVPPVRLVDEDEVETIATGVVQVSAATVSGQVKVSPRPRARADAAADAVAFAAARHVAATLATEGSTDLGQVAPETGPVAPAEGTAPEPSAVSLASMMSKAPSVGAPVPSYLHGVYR